MLNLLRIRYHVGVGGRADTLLRRDVVFPKNLARNGGRGRIESCHIIQMELVEQIEFPELRLHSAMKALEDSDENLLTLSNHIARGFGRGILPRIHPDLRISRTTNTLTVVNQELQQGKQDLTRRLGIQRNDILPKIIPRRIHSLPFKRLEAGFPRTKFRATPQETSSRGGGGFPRPEAD
ncbi:MAG: hypothetical protein IPJ48_18335 [Propionivibrio sp.]|uniref:Uncharacterized protein n=1 Tax=Candidatus Propionivibrio dominans TaxID=2954373 RepID=A0A9D7FF91_9RHOO|nr:hypothetical protein [Candidatus Propionivibrio dominans]